MLGYSLTKYCNTKQLRKAIDRRSVKTTSKQNQFIQGKCIKMF